MRLSSPAFANGRLIQEKYTCRGDNISPQLQFIDPPESTKSFALIMHDPDAPDGDWVHWTVWNIDPKASGIPEAGGLVGSVEGITSFGRAGYGGPCPHSGTHHYYFDLYALDKKLKLDPKKDRAALEAAMAGHILAKADIVGLFSKN